MHDGIPAGPGTPQTMHPRDQAPPSPGPGSPPPPRPGTPPVESMLGDAVNARAVRILLECNLVLKCCHVLKILFPSFVGKTLINIHTNYMSRF